MKTTFMKFLPNLMWTGIKRKARTLTRGSVGIKARAAPGNSPRGPLCKNKKLREWGGGAISENCIEFVKI